MKAKTKKIKKKLVLLDAHAIIHRAYHALPDFMNSQGQSTGAIYGVSTMLFKIITELNPDYIVACYDLPKKTFRHEAYADYKAGRAKTDDSLISQFALSRELFESLSIPIYELEGFEADDILGTISTQMKKDSGTDVVIASGDMDTLQLVDKSKVQVYTLKKGINDTILYNEDRVVERFNFKPKSLVDYKGLRGDPSDNIIGIKGIGEKTATILVKEYGTIEKLYKALKKNPEKVKALGLTDRIISLLQEGEEEALFSKMLATIRLDVPILFKLPKKKWREDVQMDTVIQFFQKMEFKSLKDRFLKIFSKEGVEKEDKKEKEKTPSKDKEDKVEPKKEEEIKAQIAFWLLNSEKTNPDIEEVLEYKGSKNIDEALEKLEEDIKKEDLDYIYRDIEVPIIPIIKQMEDKGVLVDKPYLKKLSTDYHKLLSKLEKDIWGIAGVEFNINSPKQLSEALFETMGIPSKGIKKNSSGSFSTRESELEKLLDKSEIISKLLEYRELKKLLSTYIDTIPKAVGSDGRLHASFMQMGTTTGRFASKNPNLQNIPIKTEKGKNIRNAFVAPSGSMLAAFDYSQIELRVAALMSQDPYFIKVFKDDKDIHSAVAMKVFNLEKEEDVTADMRRRAKVINFGILYGMGVNALRKSLVNPNSSLNENAEKVTRKEAQEFYDNYFAQFPTIASYLESIKTFAKKHGYTKTLFGRKRYFPGISSHLPFIRAMAERMATNAPIQGTATADIIKISMKKVDEGLRNAGLIDDVVLILQVHDELIFEIKKSKVSEAVEIIQKAMESAIPEQFMNGLNEVPLKVSIGIGENWGSLDKQ